MIKYKQYFQEMIENNKEVFDSFKKIHDDFAKDQSKNKEEFNKQGQKIVDIIHDYESRLCSKSQGSGYGKFSTSLSEKFWNEVRACFPYIDFVGIK